MSSEANFCMLVSQTEDSSAIRRSSKFVFLSHLADVVLSVCGSIQSWWFMVEVSKSTQTEMTEVKNSSVLMCAWPTQVCGSISRHVRPE
jgi:hypothetical protein